MESVPLILTNLTPPEVPLITGVDNAKDISIIISYIQSLVDYLYNINVPISTDELILTPVTRVENTPISFFPSTSSIWLDAASTVLYTFFRVPESYISGDLTVTVGRRGAATGTAVMTWQAFRFRDNTAFSTAVSSTPVNFTPGDTNTHYIVLTIPATTFTIGDIIRVDITRDGANGSDDMTTNVGADGVTISYTAYKGIP